MITAKHSPGVTPFFSARCRPARHRSAMAMACGTVKLTVAAVGDPLGDAVLEHVETRGHRGELHGDVRRPGVMLPGHGHHRLALARARRVDLGADEAALARAGVEVGLVHRRGARDDEPHQRLGLLLRRRPGWRAPRRSPAAHAALFLASATLVRNGLVVTPTAPRSRPRWSSAGSAESCHHDVFVFSTSQLRYVPVFTVAPPDSILSFATGVEQLADHYTWDGL